MMAGEPLDLEIKDRGAPATVELLRDVTRLTRWEIELLISAATGKGMAALSAEALKSFSEKRFDEDLSEGAARTRLYRLREKLDEFGEERALQILEFLLLSLEGETGTFYRYRRCGQCKTAVFLRPLPGREVTLPRGVSCPVCKRGGGGHPKKVRLVGEKSDTSPSRILARVMGD